MIYFAITAVAALLLMATVCVGIVRGRKPGGTANESIFTLKHKYAILRA